MYLDEQEELQTWLFRDRLMRHDLKRKRVKYDNTLTETVPCLGYFVLATYEDLTVSTTAFIRFLAA